jgi:protein-disulfide isomerase
MINQQAKLRVPISSDDRRQGPAAHASFDLVEYGDYECPFCGEAYWTVKQLQESLGSELRFVFRNFPLTQVHPNAMNAARAAEAAGFQEQFWPMHDMIYEHQDALDVLSLLSYAQVLSLDMDRFNNDMVSRHTDARILKDFESGVRSGVNGTPTFFVNGFRLEGQLTYDALLDATHSARRGLP